MKQLINVQQSIFIVFFLTFSVMLVASVHASEFHVTTSQELQTALSTAAENNQSDSIFLAAGIYAGSFRFDTEESKTMLSIQANEGLNAGHVILDGEERDRVLLINSGQNEVNIMIERLTFRNGKETEGAGIKILSKGEVEIKHCNIQNNVGSSCYGAILNVRFVARLLITKTIIKNNTVYVSRNCNGGVIFSTDIGSFSFIDNEISFNNCPGSYSYGAIYVTANDAVINQNIISSNKSQYYSGCYISTENEIIFTNNTISLNENSYLSSASSGVVNLSSPEVEFKNNHILENQGAVYISASSSIQLESSYISKNLGSPAGVLYVDSAQITARNNLITNNDPYDSTSSKGCLYLTSSGTINLVNNTISNNKTKGYGGGLYVSINNTSAILNLYNNIIWGNIAETEGNDIYINGYGSKKNYFNNNVHEIVGTFDFSANNIDVAPLFVNAEKGDYHLGTGSLCLDAGTNDAPELPEHDMDGNLRIGDNTVDIGAYEHSRTDFHPADTNKDWDLTTIEVSEYETAWKNGNTWAEAPVQIPMNYLTRAGFILQSGGTYENTGGAKPLCWIPVD
jgi:hypothetical protein